MPIILISTFKDRMKAVLCFVSWSFCSSF